MRIFFCLFLFWPGALQAQALLAGSEYYDSFQTLAQVVIMQAAGNQAGRDYLVSEGHILPKNEQSLAVILIARGTDPQSGAEFRFPAYPRTYWTFSENIATAEELHADPSPSPSPVIATPTPTPSPRPVARKKTPKPGAIQWHLVDGRWKWRPLEPHNFKGVAPGSHAPAGESGP